MNAVELKEGELLKALKRHWKKVDRCGWCEFHHQACCPCGKDDCGVYGQRHCGYFEPDFFVDGIVDDDIWLELRTGSNQHKRRRKGGMLRLREGKAVY